MTIQLNAYTQRSKQCPKLQLPPVFCYGSNNPKQLAQRLGHNKFKKERAWLPKYGRIYRGYSNKWQGGVATPVPDPERTTFGYVAHLTDEDIETLDEYEGIASGAYYKKTIRLKTDSGSVYATVYLKRNIFQYNQ